MRKHATSWLIKILLGGIIIAFVFWFGWGGSRHTSERYLAKVNDTIISYDDFNRVYDLEIEKIRQRFKGALPPDFVEKLNLKKTVLQGMINQILLLQEAERLGLFVTDQDLEQDIRTNPRFQLDGRFDANLYRNFLRTVKFNAEAYEHARKRELLEQQLVHVLTDAVGTDPTEIKRLWHFQNDKLQLAMLAVPPEQKTDQTSIDNKVLQSYFDKNQAKYEVPASLDLQFVVLSWRDLEKDITMTDEDAELYYKNHPKEFVTPERIKARHILFAIPEDADEKQVQEIRQKAEAVLARIKAGEDFGTVAAAESQDTASASKGGELGFFSRGTMNSDFEKAAFRLEVGKISPVVRTKQGFHLIEVEEKKPETEIEFSAVKDKIIAKLREEKARRDITKIADSFYDKVYTSEKLAETAEKFGFKVQEAAAVTKSLPVPELADAPKLMAEAHQLKPGEISRMVAVGDQFVVMKLVKRNKEHVPPFADVQDKVERDYLKEQALLNARKKADDIIEDLKKQPQDPDAIAQKFGLTWTKLEATSRTAGFVPQLGNSPEVNEMLTTISATAPVFPTPIATSDGMVVVRLTGMDTAPDERFEKESQAFEHWVLEVRRTEILKGWLRVLEDKAKIDIAQKL
jgi:peptidyl-prolyl cis-trans isomerase D